MAGSNESSIHELLARILRPIVAIGVRKGLKIQDFVAVLRRVLLETAANHLSKNGSELSASRLSVITGLRRPEAQSYIKSQVQALASGHSQAAASRPASLITKILGVWQFDRRFSTKPGHPRPLSTEGTSSDFARLVHTVSQDLSHHTVLFELERLKIVDRDGTFAKLDLLAFQDRTSEDEGLRMLAEDLAALTHAIEENVRFPTEVPHLHARTVFDNLPLEVVPKLRKWLLNFGQRIHLQARKALSQNDRDLNRALPQGEGRAKVSFISIGVITSESATADASSMKAPQHSRRRKKGQGANDA